MPEKTVATVVVVLTSVAITFAAVPDKPVVTEPVVTVATDATTKYAVIQAIAAVPTQVPVMLIVVPAVRHVVIRHVVTRQPRIVVMT